MMEELYYAYQMIICMAITFVSVRCALECRYAVPKIVVVGIGIILLLISEQLAAFLLPVFFVLLGVLLVVFLFVILGRIIFKSLE